jgi:hypothetical protein
MCVGWLNVESLSSEAAEITLYLSRRNEVSVNHCKLPMMLLLAKRNDFRSNFTAQKFASFQLLLLIYGLD